MANTRHAIVHELPFVVFGGVAFGIRCPGCHRVIGIGEAPSHGLGYRIRDDGLVLEWVVCTNCEDGKYCDWAGHVRLARQVRHFKDL